MKRLALLALLAVPACLDDIELPPDPPTLDLLSNTVRTKTLKGTKPAGTKVLLGADQATAFEIAPLDDSDRWRATVELVPGENDLVLWTRSASGLFSYEPLEAVVIFEPSFPDPVTLDQPLALFTNALPVVLSGTKPLGSRVVRTFLDGAGAAAEEELAPLDNDATWSAELDITVEGAYPFALLAEDARGKRSEPLDVVVTYDITPPAIESRFPLDGDPGATNGTLSIVLNEDLALDASALPAGLVSVKNGLLDVAGFSVTYVPETRALRVASPASPGWPANASLTVRIDNTALVDLAGNASTRAADFILLFSIGNVADTTVPGPVVLTDPAPLGDADADGALELFAAAVDDKTLTLTGTKPAPSSLVINDTERVPLSSATDFTVTIPIARGENTLRLVAVSPAEVPSVPELIVEVTRVVLPPNPPVVNPFPASVEDAEVELSGTRDANTTLILDGVPVVPRGPETTWDFVAELNPGTNTKLLIARLVDEGEILESAPVPLTIELVQQYEGNVREQAELEVSFQLKDLSLSDPIRGEFETADNCYGVDIWLEGPLEPGEQCVFAGGERQNIKYADTVVHYKGTLSGHITPWADEDYRNPDYLAALVSAGRLPDYAAGADRRDDDTGTPNPGFGLPVTISESEVDTIDGVTAATLKPGATQSFSWTQSASTRPVLAQGEYLVHVVINLDRGGTWLTDNDFETCWLDTAFATTGMHRVTARMSFGDVAYELELGESNEVSGPDVDAVDGVLRFLEGPITFTWRP